MGLLLHYEELGVEGMTREVFQVQWCSPGTRILKGATLLAVARELLSAGVNTLQDAMTAEPALVKSTLRSVKGIGPRTAHMFLMYTGHDQFVKGDVHVIHFVSSALGRKVHAREAETLLRESAARLEVSPRLLDFKVWEHGAGA